jgi:hypothetical protein
MDDREHIKIFIGSGEASVLERKTLIYSLYKHTKRKLDIYVFNGTHNAIEHNQAEPILTPCLSSSNTVTSQSLMSIAI